MGNGFGVCVFLSLCVSVCLWPKPTREKMWKKRELNNGHHIVIRYGIYRIGFQNTATTTTTKHIRITKKELKSKIWKERASKANEKQ